MRRSITLALPGDVGYAPRMSNPEPAIRGRGASWNPANRFERFYVEPDAAHAGPDEEAVLPKTQLFWDDTKTLITYNNSPDVGFSAGINPYRGCEHGCIYCYARPSHEYLGFSAGLDFETKLLVKRDAAAILRRELASRSWKPQPLALSGNTDCYQPVERKLGITRQCLKVLAECRNPVIIITKNQLVTRDIDLLAQLARYEAVGVFVSLTTSDRALQRVMEPRTTIPEGRVKAIAALRAAGIPTGVLIGPVIPGLTDHEIPGILKAAAEAGATHAGYILLRLPSAVKPLFEEWLQQHAPSRKEKVLQRIRDVRGGRLNDPRFGSRMRGTGLYAEQIRSLFTVTARRLGLNERGTLPLSIDAFRRPLGPQLSLFDT